MRLQDEMYNQCSGLEMATKLHPDDVSVMEANRLARTQPATAPAMRKGCF
jgi:hypothetical protein